MSDPTSKPEKDTLDFAQFFFGLIGMTVGVVVFTFMTFATKSDLQAKDHIDEISMQRMDANIYEIRQDIKEILKNSKHERR